MWAAAARIRRKKRKRAVAFMENLEFGVFYEKPQGMEPTREAHETMQDLPKIDLGPYRLEKLLGQGGMGAVYLAVDERLGRRLALKHVQPASASPARRRRFRREAAILARLSHPAIVQVFDLVETADGDWIVMELIDGPTVADLVADGPLPIVEVLDIGRQVAGGLAEAHRHGVLHRDLKAENIMLHRSGRETPGSVKIVDFGLAKTLPPVAGERDLSRDRLSQTGQLLGTFHAISPEQARGLPADARSDLFSLGALLYRMTAGRLPFRGETPFDTLHRVIAHPHEPLTALRPGTPIRLSELVDRLLEKSPELRPASAGEVAEELAAIAEGKVSEARWPAAETWDSETYLGPAVPDPGAAVAGAPAGKRWTAVWLLAAVLLAGAVAVLGFERFRQVGAPPAEMEAAGAPPAAGVEALVRDGMDFLERADKPGHLERAIAAFEAALARDERSAHAHAGLALAYQQQYIASRDPLRLEQAVAVAERAVALEQGLGIARVALGTSYSYAGRYEDALGELTTALELEPADVEVYRELGQVHRRQGELDEAIAAYLRAVELAPDDRTLRDQLGILYYRTARYREAEVEILQSIELAPDRASAYRDLSAVYYMQGRLAEAAEALQKALAIQPEHSLYSNLGTILFAQGLYPPAASAYEKALAHGGGHFYLYWANLGDAYRQMAGYGDEARGSYGQAIRLLRRELDKLPDSTFLLSRLALYRAKRGDCREAVSDLQELARLASPQAEDLYRIAVACEVCGERDRALAALAEALAGRFPQQEVERDPELFGLRSDPRYHRLLSGGA